MTTLRRWSRHIRPTPIEREILDYVMWAGRDYRWTMFIGTNLAAVLGCNLGKHANHVDRALTKLVRRSWLKKGTDDDGRRFVQLTPSFVAACDLAQQRHEVRRILGPETWQKINGSDKTADALHELTLTMTQSRYRDRVKAAAKVLIDGTGRPKKPTNESLAANQRIVGSQPTNRGLRLIAGERKSAT